MKVRFSTKAGRPPDRDRTRIKEARIVICLTNDEKAALESQARDNEWSLPAWIRMRLGLRV